MAMTFEIQHQRHSPMKERIDKLHFIKMINFWFIVCERQSQIGRKYLQEIHLIKDCHPRYTRTT